MGRGDKVITGTDEIDSGYDRDVDPAVPDEVEILPDVNGGTIAAASFDEPASLVAHEMDSPLQT